MSYTEELIITDTLSVLNLLLVKSLLDRKSKGIHPCMMDYLIGYIMRGQTSAYYDGDHIKELPTHSKDILLYHIGYDHLISSFKDLNDLERLVLKAAFLDEEIYLSKQNVLLKLIK